jgi:hypothetical protein
MEELASDRIEGELAFAAEQVSVELGCYFDQVVA